MAPESESNLRLEIGHVLFIDIVGYSKRDEDERLRRLTEIVLATTQVAKSTNEQLVRLPTGDGMALVFRNSSEEPAQCALEIAQALKAHPKILVRMGIHSGPVSEVTDVSGRTNIAGAGINMAQRRPAQHSTCPLPELMRSFMFAQGDRRIDLHRATRRKIAGDNRNGEQQARDGANANGSFGRTPYSRPAINRVRMSAHKDRRLHRQARDECRSHVCVPSRYKRSRRKFRAPQEAELSTRRGRPSPWRIVFGLKMRRPFR